MNIMTLLVYDKDSMDGSIYYNYDDWNKYLAKKLKKKILKKYNLNIVQCKNSLVLAAEDHVAFPNSHIVQNMAKEIADKYKRQHEQSLHIIVLVHMQNVDDCQLAIEYANKAGG